MISQSFIASFTGSSIEFFETAAIAYAICRAGHPREAISALILGHFIVFTLAIFLFPLHTNLPIFWLRLIASILLVFMGLQWTIKSLWRIKSHIRPQWAVNPLAEVHVNSEELTSRKFSPFVFFVMAKSSVVEASEILLIVFPIAASQAAWSQVIWGVVVGIFTVSAVTLLLHGQLKNIPEVKLKLFIGIILTVIGVTWLSELYIDYI